MGFGVGEKSLREPALWERYADRFPVRERLIYLNHAAVAPLCRPAAEAMQQLADDCMNNGSLHYDEWLAAYEGVRVAAARLIHADRSEIALMKNTSEGIATVAMGIDWKPGDRIVAFEEEFPANYFPWKRLERKGVRVTWLSVQDPLDRIDKACRGARLLAISFVQFLSGYRAPAQEIGEICHRNRCIYLLDAIQGLGAF
ncbi:MAG TPA: aminotransferase class V-fold PLP-dependent enzyme, partial [Bryobacteraceae bacterium]